MKNKNLTKTLTLLFLITYTVSYITRINLGAVVVEIEKVGAFSRKVLSMAVTGSCITYGLSQVISGMAGDRFSPKKLVFLGLLATSCINLSIPFCTSPGPLIILWSANGFAQAFMWPPIFKLMVSHFKGNDYKTSAVTISWGASLGTIVVYFAAPILILFFNWKAVFLFSAICGFIMMYFWNRSCIDVDTKGNTTQVQEKTDNSRVLLTPIMIGVLLSIILMGMLRDGIQTWMPTYIDETYNLGSGISILTGVLLPVFSVICTFIASKIYVKKFTNPVLCSFFAYLFGLIATLLLFFFTGKNAAISVFSSALLSGAMHIVSSMLTAMVPQFFHNNKRVTTISGVINASAYVGSAISSYAIAYFSKLFGWTFTTLSWIAIALSGTVLCMVLTKPFEKRYIKKGNLC